MREVWQSLYLWGLKPLRDVGPEGRAWAARAARGSKRAQLAWWALVLAVGSGLFAALAAAGAWIVHWRLWEYHPDSFETVIEDLGDEEYLWSYVTAWVIAAGITLVALVVMRLIWLRIGARRALLRRDKCASCGHGLSGVPIGEADLVTCPECAVRTRAVEAWNEIDRSGGERAVFAPARGLVKQFWTRRRLIQSAELSAAIAFLCALGYGGWWTVREVGIRKEAAIARAERADVDTINTRMQITPPPLAPNQTYTGDAVREILAEYETIQTDFKQLHIEGLPNASSIYVDAGWVPGKPREDETPEDVQSGMYSTMLMRVASERGLYTKLDALPTTVPWFRRSYAPVDAPGTGTSELSNIRKAMRLCVARMRIAQKMNDPDEYVLAVRSAAVIISAAATGPLLIDWLIAESAVRMVLEEHRRVLMSRPQARWVIAVEDAIRALSELDLATKLENERHAILDSLAWYFAEPSRVRKGIHAPELKENLGIGLLDGLAGMLGNSEEKIPAVLGTYSQNRDAANAMIDELISLASAEPHDRQTPGLTPSSTSSLIIVNYMGSAMPTAVDKSYEQLVSLRAARVMLDLERYRLAHGEYPATLADLPPECPTAGLKDPFSGQPFGYKLVDSDEDQFHRSYLLWSVGLDREDNGGQMDARDWHAPLRPRGKGKDWILNDPRW